MKRVRCVDIVKERDRDLLKAEKRSDQGIRRICALCESIIYHYADHKEAGTEVLYHFRMGVKARLYS